ncbi:MAG TPA: hypothetical protein VLI65_04795 [Pyrinomonadaceae bacterium]|nr:hypothetical protein [Pyrinomonadaceae bacterium]
MHGEPKVEFKGGYIHIRHGEDFEITPERTDDFWNFLAKICEEHDCSRVLAEGPTPKRRMDTVAAFQSGVQAAGVRKDLWLAIYFHNYEPDELSELFERSARNRGIHVRFFDNRDRALNWLGVGT